MKKLIVLVSVAIMLNFDVFAMKSVENNDGNKIHGCSKQPIDYRKAWTKSHEILQKFIKNAAKSESDYENALNIINKAYLNIDACDECGDTLLFEAAKLRDSRILVALLDKNPKNINTKNDDGFTAFSSFISKCYKESYSDFRKRKQSEQKEITGSLPKLKSGLDNPVSNSIDVITFLKEKFSFGFSDYDRENKIDMFTYFEEHLSYGSVYPVVKKFIEHKVDINVKNPFDEQTPLHYAVRSNDIDAVRLMLNYDSSSINDLTDLNLSALDYAVQNENIPIIELLIKKGAKVSFENLKRALEEPKFLKILLPNKDSLSKIENGEAILSHCSVFDLNEEVVDFLIDRGASVDTPSFLSDFIYHYKGNNKKLIDKVIEASGNLDCVDYTGWRFKHINPLISEKLSQAKADNAS